MYVLETLYMAIRKVQDCLSTFSTTFSPFLCFFYFFLYSPVFTKFPQLIHRIEYAMIMNSPHAWNEVKGNFPHKVFTMEHHAILSGFTS